MFLRVGEAGYRAGDSAGLVADQRHAGDDVALGVEVHVAAGCGWGFFAVVKKVGFAVAVADEHKSASADVAGRGIDDGKSEAYGYGCVDCVATLLEDFDAGVGGVVLDGDDHGVLGADGLFGDGSCLGCEGGGEESEFDGDRNKTGSDVHSRVSKGFEQSVGEQDIWLEGKASQINVNSFCVGTVLYIASLGRRAGRGEMGVRVEALAQYVDEGRNGLRCDSAVGRDERFEELVGRQARFMFQVAFGLLRNRQDAEDAVQEAFLKLYRGEAWLRMENEKGFLARTVWRVVAMACLPSRVRWMRMSGRCCGG